MTDSELDYADLRSSKRPPRSRSRFAPEVREERRLEQVRRTVNARHRVGALLIKMHRDEFDALLPAARAEVDNERGPLPGDESEGGAS